MSQFNFDPGAQGVPERDNNFELLPAGKYVGQVVESEIKKTKKGDGDILKLTFEVLTQGFSGRKLWVNLNVRNPNPEAERIAQQDLRDILTAVGMVRMSDSVQLHNKPMELRVKIRKADGQYEDQNEIRGFKAIAGTAPVAQQARPAAVQAATTAVAPAVMAAQTPAVGRPPWATR